MYHYDPAVYQSKKGGDKMKKQKVYVGIDIGKKDFFAYWTKMETLYSRASIQTQERMRPCWPKRLL